MTAIEARDGFGRITNNGLRAGNADRNRSSDRNMDIKKAVLRDFERIANDNAIYASNTSSLPITELATASNRPDRVIGMHFFNPVEKMPLVEVVRGEKTSDETVSAIATLSRKLGKLPVVVNDGPGFVVNRVSCLI
jgi:3-hydroxyacyl-CoA dehydrogenase